MKKNSFGISLIALLCAGWTIVCVPTPVFAGDEQTQNVDMVTGDLETIEVKNLTRLSVTDPAVADVSDAKPDKVLILAKKPGQTAIFLWDDDGKRAVTVRVAGEDLKALKERVQNVIARADIKGITIEESPMEGKIVLSGAISKADKATLEKITDPYAADVINLTKEGNSEDQVQIDMQITELSATLDKNLGIDWQAAAVGNPLALEYDESRPQLNGAKDWFKFGKFNRASSIISTINLMIKEGKARDLSRPRIMVSSGKEATINVGGEIPISSVTLTSIGGAGAAQQNITYKKYGLTLTVTPTVKGNKIDIVMNVQVTDVDKTFFVPATSTNGIAYKTRSAQTYLLMDDHQTLVFAGMIRYNDGDQVKSIPILGKIPVLGALFRNRSKQAPDEGKELVITLTPTIVSKKEYATDQMKMPTQAAKDFEKEIDQKQGYAREPLPTADAATAMPAPSALVPVTGPAYGGAGMTSYIHLVQMKISQAIAYPAEAMQKNWQGTVKLRLRITKDGSLSEAVVVGPSGHDVFDQDALNTAKIAAPFAAFPPDMAGNDLVVTVPIVYSQGSARSPS